MLTRTVLVFALVVVGSRAWAGDPETFLRVASEGAYPPWNTTIADGSMVGFDIDIAHELCQRLTLRCEIAAQDWEGILPGLQAGKYDAVIAGLSITGERRKLIDFAGPYARDPVVLAVRASAPWTPSLPHAGQRVDLDDRTVSAPVISAVADALHGAIIGTQVATTHADLARLLSGATVHTYAKFDDVLLDLKSGRIDAVIGSKSVLDSRRHETGADWVIVGPEFVGGVVGQGAGIGLRKGTSGLRQRIDQALVEAATDGTLAAISRRWFGFDLSAAPRTSREPASP